MGYSGYPNGLINIQGFDGEATLKEANASVEHHSYTRAMIMDNLLAELWRSEENHSAKAPNGTYPGDSNSAAVYRSNGGALQQEHIETLSISPLDESRLVSLMPCENAGSEAFRLLGVRLRHLQQERALKRLLITSSVPREGKSTAAANLSCSLAKRGEQRVLLLEGDLRRPSLTTIFGITAHPGLYECVEAGRALFSCLYYLDEAHLWLLPAGCPPANTPELLRPEGLSTVLDRLSDSFDWIIIDSPPILPIADTSIWMRLSDGILLVVRQGVSEKRPLEKGLKALESKKLLGVLLNCSRTPPHSDYYCKTSGD